MAHKFIVNQLKAQLEDEERHISRLNVDRNRYAQNLEATLQEINQASTRIQPIKDAIVALEKA